MDFYKFNPDVGAGVCSTRLPLPDLNWQINADGSTMSICKNETFMYTGIFLKFMETLKRKEIKWQSVSIHIQLQKM